MFISNLTGTAAAVSSFLNLKTAATLQVSAEEDVWYHTFLMKRIPFYEKKLLICSYKHIATAKFKNVGSIGNAVVERPQSAKPQTARIPSKNMSASYKVRRRTLATGESRMQDTRLSGGLRHVLAS